MWFKTKAKATLRENVVENKNSPIFVSYLTTELLSSIQHPKSYKNWLNTCVEKTCGENVWRKRIGMFQLSYLEHVPVMSFKLLRIDSLVVKRA